MRKLLFLGGLCGKTGCCHEELVVLGQQSSRKVVVLGQVWLMNWFWTGSSFRAVVRSEAMFLG